MSTFLEHARHNRKACDHLHENKSFPDWVVTTAFYCAMHYCHSVIFPMKHDNESFTTLEEYYVKYKRDKETKHSMTVSLIKKHHKCVWNKYKELKDTAHTARYHDYDIPGAIVQKMRRNLTVIEEYCEQKLNEINSKKAVI